jgi:hypothetical protein
MSTGGSLAQFHNGKNTQVTEPGGIFPPKKAILQVALLYEISSLASENMFESKSLFVKFPFCGFSMSRLMFLNYSYWLKRGKTC